MIYKSRWCPINLVQAETAKCRRIGRENIQCSSWICWKVSAIISAWLRIQFVCGLNSKIARESILRESRALRYQACGNSPMDPRDPSWGSLSGWGSFSSWGSFLSWGNGRACSVRRTLGATQGKLSVELDSTQGLRGFISVKRWWVLG